MKMSRPVPTAAVLAVAVSACGATTGSSGDGPQVVASFYPLAFVAERVAGDHANVSNLTQPGSEAHDLEPTAKQVGQVVDADMVLYMHDFQPAVDAAIDQNAGGTVVEVSEFVETIESHEEHEHAEGEEREGHDHGSTDPHFWLDPTNMMSITEAVADELATIDPDHADDYSANADDLIADLEQLDQDFADGLARCERTVFVTSHEAFGYLAHRYGLEQVGISGVDPESEPSPERLAEVHDVVTSEDVTTIFYERLVSPKVAETLASDLGVEAAVLDPIEGLTDDTADEDYLSLMSANLSALREANGCS